MVMSEEENKQPAANKMRTSTKALYGGGVLAAILTFTPIKNLFWTREEGNAIKDQIASVAKNEQSHYEEIIHRQERLADKIIDRIRESEERTVKNADRLERRVDIIEASRLNSSFRTKNN
jgi:predicted type IV restriction endonuclease